MVSSESSTSDQTSVVKPPRPIKYLPTIEAYDLWASVYDQDSNPLQALDDIEVSTLLPEFLALLPPSAPSSHLKVVDLGCGTGRNTVKLLIAPGVQQIVGLDASANMLAIARKRCERYREAQLTSSKQARRLVLEEYDILGGNATALVPSIAEEADAVVSTLVLEHLPLDKFFRAVSSIVKPGGLFLLTNMHPDMGVKSQAGFVDVRTGEKVRPVSYAHRIEDIAEEASRWDFDFVGQVREREARAGDVDSEGVGNRIKKWIGIKMWFGMVLKKRTTQRPRDEKMI